MVNQTFGKNVAQRLNIYHINFLFQNSVHYKTASLCIMMIVISIIKMTRVFYVLLIYVIFNNDGTNENENNNKSIPTHQS